MRTSQQWREHLRDRKASYVQGCLALLLEDFETLEREAAEDQQTVEDYEKCLDTIHDALEQVGLASFWSNRLKEGGDE